MNCQELSQFYDLYALNLAEEPERGEIHAHLIRACPNCTAGVRQSLETAGLIALSAPVAEPSKQLRDRILASVGAEPRRIPWILGWAATAAAILLAGVAIYFAIGNRNYASDVARLRSEMGEQTAQIARLTEAFAIVSGPGTVEATFGGANPRPPQGYVFVNPSRGVLLIGSDLPPAQASKVYEMWLIPKAGKPVPAGLFQSQANGTVMHVRPGAVDVASTAAVAVTVENQAGAAQPTTTPFIVAALARSPR